MAQTPAREQTLNPFPHYAMMRESSPVHHDPETDTWNVFRYDDVQHVLSDHALFSSRLPSGVSDDNRGPFASSLISTDPPRHRQLRSLVTQAFTPRAVAALAPRITDITNELLDQTEGAASMDLVQELAYPLPVIVIAELLGIPATDRDRFKVWSDAVVSQTRTRNIGDQMRSETSTAQVTAELAAVNTEMIGYFLEKLEERRKQPGDDLISSLLAAQIGDEQLSVPELLGFCSLLLVAGNETTTHLLGSAVLSFTERPGTIEALRAEPELIPQAVEEVLRFRSPVQFMFRRATVETTLGGHDLEAGSRVIAWIGSANRDERPFPEPDTFDIRRSPNRHLAFGQGIHFCLGAPLARLEATIALRALTRRLPGLALAEGHPLERVESALLYGVKSLPVTWRPTALI